MDAAECGDFRVVSDTSFWLSIELTFEKAKLVDTPSPYFASPDPTAGVNMGEK
jgi:hypothetical protein